jgi:hypothetical protein
MYTNYTDGGAQMDIKSFTINTNYRTMWLRFFNDALSQIGLTNGTITDPTSDYEITINGNDVMVNFCNGAPYASAKINHVYFNLRLTTINVQIAPGWIG